MTRYKCHFPIGDWSGDGHEKCEYFLVSSNMHVEDIREVHRSCKEKLGFAIEDMCRDYGDTVLDKEIEKILTEKGIIGEEVEDHIYCDDEVQPSPEYLCEIWVKILNHINPELDLVLENEGVEVIVQFGFENKDPVKCPGYGLFE